MQQIKNGLPQSMTWIIHFFFLNKSIWEAFDWIQSMAFNKKKTVCGWCTNLLKMYLAPNEFILTYQLFMNWIPKNCGRWASLKKIATVTNFVIIINIYVELDIILNEHITSFNVRRQCFFTIHIQMLTLFKNQAVEKRRSKRSRHERPIPWNTI